MVDDGTCEGACESIHSLRAWVFGFLIIFGVVIAAGALVGGLVAFVKWSRGTGGTLSTLTGDKEKIDGDQHHRE